MGNAGTAGTATGVRSLLVKSRPTPATLASFVRCHGTLRLALALNPEAQFGVDRMTTVGERQTWISLFCIAPSLHFHLHDANCQVGCVKSDSSPRNKFALLSVGYCNFLWNVAQKSKSSRLKPGGNISNLLSCSQRARHLKSFVRRG